MKIKGVGVQLCPGSTFLTEEKNKHMYASLHTHIYVQLENILKQYYEYTA